MTAPAPAPPAADRPAHYRLSTATWELIVKEYREGATAPFLARKWRVSEHALRRRVTRHGASKRAWGDSQAIAQALAREAELEEARRNAPEAVAARLFAGLAELEGAEAENPAALMRQATLAAGRAMRGRLWSEAQALAKLAESFARLDKEQRQSEEARTITYEKLPLSLVMDILEGGTLKVPHDIFIRPDKPDADLEHKRRWHRMDFYRRHGEDPPWWRGPKLSGVIVR